MCIPKVNIPTQTHTFAIQVARSLLNEDMLIPFCLCVCVFVPQARQRMLRSSSSSFYLACRLSHHVCENSSPFVWSLFVNGFLSTHHIRTEHLQNLTRDITSHLPLLLIYVHAMHIPTLFITDTLFSGYMSLCGACVHFFYLLLKAGALAKNFLPVVRFLLHPHTHTTQN